MDDLTPSEAYELLGVDASASPKELKRAYLRKTKVFKPERDPDGFQRLRAAYELARELNEIGAHMSVISPVVDATHEPEPQHEAEPEHEAEGEVCALPIIPEHLVEYFVDEVPSLPIPPAAMRLLEYLEQGNRSQARCVYDDHRAEWDRITARPDHGVESRVIIQACMELVEREAIIPDDFVEWMARGFRAEDLELSNRAIENLAREHPFAASQMLEAFESEGSVLSLFYADALRSGASIEEVPESPLNDRVSLVIRFAVSVLIFFAMLHFKCGVFS